jgi:hypothetical protein
VMRCVPRARACRACKYYMKQHMHQLPHRLKRKRRKGFKVGMRGSDTL